LKGYNARQLRTEFPDKGWRTTSINRLLKKFRDTGTVDRRQSIDRPRSARAVENIDHAGERYGSDSRGWGPVPNSQHSPWNITEDRHS